MNNGKQQAFPSTRKYIDGNTEVINIQFGLTKREYFAAMAMQGILGNNRELDSLGGSPIKISKHCIEMADILLFELEKTKSE